LFHPQSAEYSNPHVLCWRKFFDGRRQLQSVALNSIPPACQKETPIKLDKANLHSKHRGTVASRGVVRPLGNGIVERLPEFTGNGTQFSFREVICFLQDGQKQTDFIRVKVWRKLAEVVAQHSGKGRLVAVEGRIEVRNYEAQDGSKRTSTEVIADNIRFLDWPKEQGGGEQLAQDVQDVFGGLDENNDFPF